MHDTKRCPMCGLDKPVGEFWPRRNRREGLGLSSYCKPCSLQRKRDRYLSKLDAKHNRVDGEGNPVRRCCRCGLDKPRSDFAKRSRARGGLSHRCKDCDRVYRRERYTANPEAQRQRARHYREDNPAAVRSRQARYYAANRQRLALRRAARYQLTREEAVERALAWSRTHPDAVRAAKARRRARKRAAGGSYTSKDVEALLTAQDGRCFYCGQILEEAYHVDHMIPLARGGSNGTENLCLACGTCNQRKYTRTAEEFRIYLALLTSSARPGTES